MTWRALLLCAALLGACSPSEGGAPNLAEPAADASPEPDASPDPPDMAALGPHTCIVDTDTLDNGCLIGP